MALELMRLSETECDLNHKRRSPDRDRKASGTGLGLGLLSSAGCGSSSSAQTPPPWDALARKLSGPLLRPGDPGFSTIAQPNNLRYAKVLPGGIARCQSAEDVAQSILWSHRYAVPLVARSGGHSYAGYSTTTGLMIDLSLMNQIQFNSSTGVVTMGGGTRNGDISIQRQRQIW